MKWSPISISAAVVGSSLILAQVAQAQTAAGQGTGTAAGGDQLQEVLVTAEKVQESAQRTPISMEVYNAQSLLQHDITTVQNLVTIDPSLNAVGPTGYLALRGVASFDTTEIGNPSVPVVIDDFSTNRFFGLEVSMFDLQRIEVLRGPQGTLYGRSATGGVINIITNKPTKQFEATGSAEYGTYNWFQTNGTINVPAASWLQLRAAFQTQRNDGYHGSLTGTKGFDVSGMSPSDVNQRGDDTDNRAGRVQVAFEAGNSFTGLLQFEDIWVGGIGPVTQNIPMVFAPSLHGDVTHQKPALAPPGSFPVYGEPWQRINQKVGKWNFAYSGLPGDMTLTFLGGYGLIEFHSLGVGSNAYTGLADPSSPFYPYLPPRQYNNNQEPHDINSELRLTSGTRSPLTWQLGLYLFQEDNTLNNRGIYAAGGTGLSLPAGAPGLAGIQPGGDYIEFPFPEIRQASHAAYGQGSYAINDQNKITLGVRYSEDWVLRTVPPISSPRI
jgi:iron complex outermembrane receptor protein